MEAGDDDDAKPLVRPFNRSASPPIAAHPSPKRPLLLYLIILGLSGTVLYYHGQLNAKEYDLKDMDRKYREKISSHEVVNQKKVADIAAEVDRLKAEKEEISQNADDLESKYEKLKETYEENQKAYEELQLSHDDLTLELKKSKEGKIKAAADLERLEKVHSECKTLLNATNSKLFTTKEEMEKLQTATNSATLETNMGKKKEDVQLTNGTMVDIMKSSWGESNDEETGKGVISKVILNTTSDDEDDGTTAEKGAVIGNDKSSTKIPWPEVDTKMKKLSSPEDGKKKSPMLGDENKVMNSEKKKPDWDTENEESIGKTTEEEKENDDGSQEDNDEVAEDDENRSKRTSTNEEKDEEAEDDDMEGKTQDETSSKIAKEEKKQIGNASKLKEFEVENGNLKAENGENSNKTIVEEKENDDDAQEDNDDEVAEDDEKSSQLTSAAEGEDEDTEKEGNTQDKTSSKIAEEEKKQIANASKLKEFEVDNGNLKAENVENSNKATEEEKKSDDRAQEDNDDEAAGDDEKRSNLNSAAEEEDRDAEEDFIDEAKTKDMDSNSAFDSKTSVLNTRVEKETIMESKGTSDAGKVEEAEDGDKGNKLKSKATEPFDKQVSKASDADKSMKIESSGKSAKLEAKADEVTSEAALSEVENKDAESKPASDSKTHEKYTRDKKEDITGTTDALDTNEIVKAKDGDKFSSKTAGSLVEEVSMSIETSGKIKKPESKTAEELNEEIEDGRASAALTPLKEDTSNDLAAAKQNIRVDKGEIEPLQKTAAEVNKSKISGNGGKENQKKTSR